MAAPLEPGSPMQGPPSGDDSANAAHAQPDTPLRPTATRAGHPLRPARAAPACSAAGCESERADGRQSSALLAGSASQPAGGHAQQEASADTSAHATQGDAASVGGAAGQSGRLEGAAEAFTSLFSGYGVPWTLSETGAMPTVWRGKWEWAARTGLACLIASVLLVFPGIKHARFYEGGVLAPILSIVGCQMNLGATVAWAIIATKGIVLGTIASIIMIQVAIATGGGSSTSDWVTFLLFMISTFFIASRPPLGLGEIKLACAIMIFATYFACTGGYADPWYRPLKLLPSALAGSAAAILANIIPYPHLASAEVRVRATFQARAIQALLGAQDLVVLSGEVGSMAHAEQLLCVVEDNVSAMQKLITAAETELVWHTKAARRLHDMIHYYDSLLPSLRGKQVTLRQKVMGEQSRATHCIHGMVFPKWLDVAKVICALAEEVARAYSEKRAVDQEIVDELKEVSEEWGVLSANSRAAVLYRGGSLYIPPQPGENRAQEQCQKVPDFTKGKETRGAPCRRTCQRLRRAAVFVPSLFRECPDQSRVKAAIKKTAALSIAASLYIFPRFRTLIPQAFWVGVTVSFVFSDTVGSSTSTGMLRLSGTLLGSIYGMYAATLIGVSDVGFVASLVPWVAIVCLFRGSPTHGYLAVCAAFTAPVIMVGTMVHLPDEGRDVGTYALHRIQTNTLGALLFMFVEVTLWPAKMRSTVRLQQVKVLAALREGITDALLAWAPFIEAERKSRKISGRARASTLQLPFTPRSAGSSQQNWSHLSEAGQITTRAIPKTSAGACKGLKIVAASLGALVTADAEPALWRPPFPRNDYTHALLAEQTALRIVAAMHSAARTAPLSDVPPRLASLFCDFAEEAQVALTRAMTAWARSAGAGAPVSDAGEVAAPFSVVRTRVCVPLQRAWAEFTMADFDRVAPVHQDDQSLAWHTVVLLCLELAAVLERIGEHLRGVRARETMRMQLG
eukprot:TRINITY_DN29473_c0_g1_i1.p1 TRINITY_DN29473_c0_g1~~TRINITY_DN29473_c0_g1_i1.p1  ORF type:complete len:1024 (+),score=144.37 TRINITY_DN29473_c0_g1_i1:175-3072(+)